MRVSVSSAIFLIFVGLYIISLFSHFSGHQKQVEINWHAQSAMLNQKWTHIAFHSPSWSLYNNDPFAV